MSSTPRMQITSIATGTPSTPSTRATWSIWSTKRLGRALAVLSTAALSLSWPALRDAGAAPMVSPPPSAATSAPGAAPLGPATTSPPSATSGAAATAGPPGTSMMGPASPVPPTAQTAAGASAASAAGDGATPGAHGAAGAAGGAALENGGGPLGVPRVVLTADASAAESDHDAVVGAWGVEVHPVATTLPVFSRRASTGCPIAPVSEGVGGPAGADCPSVAVSMLGVRHWVNRNLAWTVGAALAMGGGTQAGRLLDSYLGFGPGAGVSILLGNWRHLAVAASPALSLVWFKAAGSTPTTYVADLRADLEGELHFGFIGVPALSLAIRSGMLLRLEKSAELTLWSAGVSGATSLRGLVSDLTLRYYF